MTQLRLNRRLIGMRWNCSPSNPKTLTREEFMDQIIQARQMVGSFHRTLFCPKPAFTNRVVWIGEDDDVYDRQVMHNVYGPGDPKNDYLVDVNFDNTVLIGQEEVTETIMTRTLSSTDGGIVRGAGNAIAFFNADCPIIALVGGIKEETFPGEHDKLALLHAGFRTLIREDKDEPNIIESAMTYFNPEHTRAFVGYGIGPCCWVPEYDDKPEILNPSKARHADLLADSLSKTTQESPFGSGHVSVDLYKLAKGLLMEVGIPANKILVNSRCTCCAKKEDGQPLFWSHNRFKAGKQEIDGRNMAIAFLDSHLINDGFETL